MSLGHTEEHAAIHTDNVGVVQVLRRGGINCICAKHSVIEERGWRVTVQWVKAHTTKEQRCKKTSHRQLSTEGNGMSGELTKFGADEVGAMLAACAAEMAH